MLRLGLKWHRLVSQGSMNCYAALSIQCLNCPYRLENGGGRHRFINIIINNFSLFRLQHFFCDLFRHDNSLQSGTLPLNRHTEINRASAANALLRRHCIEFPAP